MSLEKQMSITQQYLTIKSIEFLLNIWFVILKLNLQSSNIFFLLRNFKLKDRFYELFLYR